MNIFLIQAKYQSQKSFSRFVYFPKSNKKLKLETTSRSRNVEKCIYDVPDVT